MEIIDSAAPSKIVIKLDFFTPFEAHNVAEFTFSPGQQGTTVQWAMHGPSSYLSKLLDLVFNMDRMVGSQFETGLSNLKAIAEK